MATLTFRCPSCQATERADLATDEIVCPKCSVSVCKPGSRSSTLRTDTAADESTDANAETSIDQCLVCNGRELFIRKDFPQRFGVTIVVLGFAASCVTWNYQWVVATFGILFGTAFIDIALYFLMGNVLECYQCHCQYRGLPQLDGHDPFDLEIHERHRQQSARLKSMANGQLE